MILAGEIGGERTSLALFATDGAAGPGAGGLRLLRAATVDNGEYPGLRPVVRRFAAEDLPRLVAACLVLTGFPPWPAGAVELGAELAAATGLPDAEVIAAIAGGEAISAGDLRAESSEPAARADPAPAPGFRPATPLWRAARRAARAARRNAAEVAGA